MNLRFSSEWIIKKEASSRWDTVVDFKLRDIQPFGLPAFHSSAFWTSSFLDFLLKGTFSFSGFRIFGLPAQRDFQFFGFRAFGLPAFWISCFLDFQIFVLLAFWTSRLMNFKLFRLPAQKAFQFLHYQLFGLPAFQTTGF